MIVVEAEVRYCTACGWADVLNFNCKQDEGTPACNVCSTVLCVSTLQHWKLIPASASGNLH